MFDRITSRNFLAPRRQEGKEEIFSCSSELSVLCVFARVIFSDSVSQYSTENFKYVWLDFRRQETRNLNASFWTLATGR
jgi:hypothetical protein